MRPTVRLGRIAGIDIGLHWSIAVIAVLLATTLSGSILPSTAPGYADGSYLLVAVLMAVLFLGSIVAHELGHSLVALRNGVRVEGVTLFALGGVAALRDEPPSPGAAARIAAAGPAVSVAFGAGSLVMAYAAGLLGASSLLVAGFTWLGLINVGLAVFNMLPALPLDGGRVLQAWFWRRSGDRSRATLSAARGGRFIGLALMGFGLWQFLGGGSGLWTALIGWFVVTAARAEAFRAQVELSGRHLSDQLGSRWSAPPPDPASRRGDVIDVDGVEFDADGRPVDTRR